MDKSSDSTQVSTKRKHDRRSHLSDAMRAQLGPQTPGIGEKPCIEKTMETRLGPSVVEIISEWPSHSPRQQQAGTLTDQAPPSSISRWLEDMFSTPFGPHIITYEHSRGFIVPKFTTLDIGNDALFCKVFPTSLHLSWFHRLPKYSMNNFRDLSEAFVGHCLCSTRHKQNISTIQNIKM